MRNKLINDPLLLLACVSFLRDVHGQDSLKALECPFPGGQTDSSEINCGLYSACQWSSTDSICHMTDNSKAGYLVASDPVDTGRGFQVELSKIDNSYTMFDDDIQELLFEVIYHEEYHMQIKITDKNNARYEIPLPLNLPTTQGTNPMANVTVHTVGQPFEFEITRISNGNSIFRSIGPLIYENQFIQLSTSQMTEYMYGFGESCHTTFKRTFDVNDKMHSYAIFARDQPVGTDNTNEYGHHPYYMAMEDDEGNSHSCLIYNSNAMEYSTFLLDDETPALTLRAIGGILDMHFFLGPEPESLNKQYMNTIGLPVFPTYQSFGFQISRWGYNSTDSIRAVRQRTKDSNIPQDIQVLDINYMDHYRDFTSDPINYADIDDLIAELHADGIIVTLILDPAIVSDFDNYPPGQRGLDADAFIKWQTSDLVPADQPNNTKDYVVGYVWPDFKTVMPDFLKPETKAWWKNEMQILHDDHEFDNIWIDMNEPANFGTDTDCPWNYPVENCPWSLKCPYNNLDSPPFPTMTTYTGGTESHRLSDHSICMSTIQTDGTNTYSHYDVHSLYGISHTIATYEAMEQIFPGQRHMVLSRSTFPGSGKYAVHWLGDNSAEWAQMAMSVIGMMEFNMFGIPYVGADICGFFGDTTEEMCTRWQEVGAFYPFSRNHNADGNAPQDPGVWPDTVAPVTRDTQLLRYRYVPYLYSLFFRAHTEGATVVRPLLNLYPSDLNVREIDDQFLWADGLMITPVLQQNTFSRNVYFPDDLWYDLRTGTLFASGPTTVFVDVPLEYIPVYLRGGKILPFQEPALNLPASRLNPFGLTVALDRNSGATGEIFWDDGMKADDIDNAYQASLDFNQNTLQVVVNNPSSYVDGLNFNTILIYGWESDPGSILVTGNPIDSSSWSYDSTYQVLNVTVDMPLSNGLLMNIL